MPSERPRIRWFDAWKGIVLCWVISIFVALANEVGFEGVVVHGRGDHAGENFIEDSGTQIFV